MTLLVPAVSTREYTENGSTMVSIKEPLKFIDTDDRETVMTNVLLKKLGDVGTEVADSRGQGHDNIKGKKRRLQA